MLETLGTAILTALVAVGGNSRAARSARAKLQWRDRFGRFIEMGRGIKFKIRLGDGTVRSVNGKFVGAIDGETGQVYVQNDPSGLQDGFYQVKSGNAQEILGSLSEDALAKKGIKIGLDANGAPVSDRADEDIPNIADIPFADAPEGWGRKPDKGGAQVWETEDGQYRLYHNYKFVKGKKTEQWGVEDTARNPGRVQNWRDIGFALKQVDANDNLPEPDGMNNDQRVAKLKEDNAARRNALASLNDTAIPLKQRLADFDTDGSIGNLIDNKADGATVLEALRKNDAWNQIENNLDHPADLPSPDQKARDGVYEKLRTEIGALTGQEPDAPAAPDAPSAEGAPAVPATPGVDGADANLELRGVAAEGYLIPTNKVGTDITPEGLAAYIEANRDFLGEGGKRLVIDTDAGTVDIANSAADLEDAKAQAGGIGAAEFYDLAANKTISNEKNVGAPNGDQSSSSNPGEPKPDESGPGAPVQPAGTPAEPAGDAPAGGPDKPAGDAAPDTDALGEPIPADRAGLTQRLAFLERATNRVSPESPRFDATYKARDDIKARLEAFKTPEAAPAPEPDKTPAADTPAPDAPPAADKAPEPAPASPEAPKPDAPATPEAPTQPAATNEIRKKIADIDTRLTEIDDVLENGPKKDSAPAAPEVPAQADRAPEPVRVDNLDQTDPGLPDPQALLPDPAVMTWNELNAELAKSIDPNSKNLREDLARYKAVQGEFFGKRGSFRAPASERDKRPGISGPVEPTPAPQPGAAPVPTPEPAPAPEAPEGDGLPDSLTELEALAGNMEREIAGARPARQKVLREQADIVYNKIEALAPSDNGGVPSDPNIPENYDLNTAERALAEPTPSEQAYIEQVAGLEGDYAGHEAFVEAENSRARNLAAGKALTAEQASAVDELDGLSDSERAQVLQDIERAPNAANTITKPRPVERKPHALVQVDPALIAREQNPDELVDPNLIMADVRKNHPEHTELANGDLVLESKMANEKLYQLVVRRTAKERFFAYILETDKDGNRRASRLQVDTHSYDALRTKIGKGKFVLRQHKNPTQWMNRRQNREVLGQNDLNDNNFEEFINGTDLPRTADEAYNKVVESIADIAGRSNTPRYFLDALAGVAGQKPEFVDMILESINRRKIIDGQVKVNDLKESHISVDGSKLTVGDWVDWTDDKQTRPVKDEFGNTVYEVDAEGAYILRYGKKVAVNEPNPDYGKVFRGRVAQLREKTNDGKYVYSDSTYVVFPDLNAQAGRKPSHQISRVGSQLKIVDDQKAPLSEPFFARKIEKRAQEGVGGGFDLPANGGNRPQPVKPIPVKAAIDENGQMHVPGFNNVNIPHDAIDAALIADRAEARSARAEDLAPGDMLVGLDAKGAPVYDTVLDAVANVGGTRVRAVRVVDDAHQIRERDLGPQKLLVLRPAPEAPDQRGVPFENKPIDQIVIGDKLHVPGVPGEGQVEGFIRGLDENTHLDWQFKVRGEDNEVYWVNGDEIPQKLPEVEVPAPEAGPDRPWHKDPASEKQVFALKRIKANRELTPEESARIEAAINDPNLTKKQASDLIHEFGPRAKAVQLDTAAKDLQNMLDALAAQAVPKQDVDALQGALAKSLAAEPNPDKYGGEIVKSLDWDQIKFGGGRAPFVNHQRVYKGDLLVGDLMPLGIGARRIYLQILADQDLNRYRVRLIGQSPEARTRLNGIARAHGDVFDIRLYGGHNVKRPTQFVAKDYFADPAKIPGPPAALFVPPPVEPEDPKMLDRIRERGQKLIDRYLNGHTIIGEGPRGADAARADIVDAGGVKMFVKGIKVRGGGLWDGDQQVKNELAANRVAQALGIEEIQMGHYMEGDNRLLIMSLVDGEPAAGKFREAQDIKNDIWNVPNAWRIGILDYLVVNVDRHDGNWMITPNGVPVPIDHGRIRFGGAYNSPFARKVERDLRDGSAPITSAELMRLKANLNLLRSEFASMGMTRQFNYMMSRMDILIGKANK